MSVRQGRSADFIATSSEVRFRRTLFMIVAHNHPSLLARLVARLKAPWTHVVVLIDAKVDERSFASRLVGQPVSFVRHESRVDVQWGGIGLTTAAVRMIRQGLAEFPADRLCMLSGVDYPIKSLHAIGQTLSSDAEFVRVDRKLDSQSSNIHDRFIRYPYFNDVSYLNPRSSPLPILQRAATKALQLVPRKQIPNLPLYHGGGWWCITREAADWILDYLDRRPSVFDWLRHANCPDEIYMQTILKASPYGTRIVQDMTIRNPEAADENVHGCHYVDWSEPNSSTPKLLDMDDLPALTRSTALFARKFDPLRSTALLDAIDQQTVM